MAERNNTSGNSEPPDPERAAARHEGDDQRRGTPGGSYGGGGGYRQGGFSRGDYDPQVERDRQWQGRSSTSRDGGPRFGYRYDAGRVRGSHGGEYERGDWDSRGDWRQGYGGYGVSDTGGMREDEVLERAPDYEGLRGSYGFGGRHQDEDRGGDEPWPYLEPWAVPGPFTGRGPEGYQRSGEAIREGVCERLTRHGRLDATGIRVQVDGSEVTLEGTVDSRSAKRMAEDTAESVAGVRDVHNRLRIRGQERGERDDEGAGGRGND
jgi:hypothetical protein